MCARGERLGVRFERGRGSVASERAGNELGAALGEEEAAACAACSAWSTLDLDDDTCSQRDVELAGDRCSSDSACDPGCVRPADALERRSGVDDDVSGGCASGVSIDIGNYYNDGRRCAERGTTGA